MNKPIDDFVKQYQNEIDEYKKIEQCVYEVIKSKLWDAGILAITSSRTKDVKSLSEKLHIRSREKQYKNIQDICDDIVDLIGLRIALYFPNDKKKVESIIRNEFDVKKVKNFPSEQRNNFVYKRRFEGYCATHYRVLPVVGSSINIQTPPMIEIQVASLLMHAWSEVEHDLSYKQRKGEVSYDEYESLDEINGLVIAGEVSLQRLQRISENRISYENKPFRNHYELASFIYDKLETNTNSHSLLVGDAEALFSILTQADRLTPKKISNDLEKVDFSWEIPISQQLMNFYADKDPKLSKLVVNTNVHKKIDFNVDEKSIGSFLSKWIKLEKSVNSAIDTMGFIQPPHKYSIGTTQRLKSLEIFSDSDIDVYNKIRETRNKLVHGVEIPNVESLANLKMEIDRLISTLKRFVVET